MEDILRFEIFPYLFGKNYFDYNKRKLSRIYDRSIILKLALHCCDLNVDEEDKNEDLCARYSAVRGIHITKVIYNDTYDPYTRLIKLISRKRYTLLDITLYPSLKYLSSNHKGYPTIALTFNNIEVGDQIYEHRIYTNEALTINQMIKEMIVDHHTNINAHYDFIYQLNKKIVK